MFPFRINNSFLPFIKVELFVLKIIGSIYSAPCRVHYFEVWFQKPGIVWTHSPLARSQLQRTASLFEELAREWSKCRKNPEWSDNSLVNYSGTSMSGFKCTITDKLGKQKQVGSKTSFWWTKVAESQHTWRVVNCAREMLEEVQKKGHLPDFKHINRTDFYIYPQSWK